MKQRIQNTHNHKVNHVKRIPFKREWPLTVVLSLIKKYQDKRAHLVRDKKSDNFELRYSVYSIVTHGWVRKKMDEGDIHSLFSDLYGV